MHHRYPGRAIVMGDRDLAAPLHCAGIRVTAVCGPASATRFSRYSSDWLEDLRPDEDALVSALVDNARRLDGPSVLYYQNDRDMLFVSGRRAELAEALRFVIPDADLVSRLADKARFQDLAVRLDLPVPPGQVLDVSEHEVDSLAISGPLLVKPLHRDRTWRDVTPAKAVLVNGHRELQELVPRLPPAHPRVLVQQPILGPETAIESYHVYVDGTGERVADFTGRKVRTHPASLGHSSALIITDAEDVAKVGRAIIEKLDLRGVAKLDFKRDDAGRLWLLEVNPRFTLWARPGAAAGVNLPALVWADLVGLPRPPVGTARSGVRWCRVQDDWAAAREQGVGLLSWVRWVATCETRSGLDPTDPVGLASALVAAAYSKFRKTAGVQPSG